LDPGQWIRIRAQPESIEKKMAHNKIKICEISCFEELEVFTVGLKASLLESSLADPHHFYADPDFAFYLMRIRILPFTQMRIRILPFNF
jgi:hypothetical protein